MLAYRNLFCGPCYFSHFYLSIYKNCMLIIKKTHLTVSDIYGILGKGRVLTGQDLGRKKKKVRESLPGTASLLRDIANLLQNPPHFLLLGLSGELFCLLRRSLKSESRAMAIWKGFLDLDPAPFWEMLRDGR